MAKKVKTPIVEVKEKETENTEVSEEVLFGEEDLENSGLRELLDKGKDQGFLTYEVINISGGKTNSNVTNDHQENWSGYHAHCGFM